MACTYKGEVAFFPHSVGMPQKKKSIAIKKNKMGKQQTASQQSLNQSPTPFRRTVMTHISPSPEKKITKSAFFDGAVARKS